MDNTVRTVGLNGDTIKGSRLELDDCVCRLEFLKDNLHCVRFAIVGEEVSDLRMIDNAIYSITLGLEELMKR